MSARKTPARKVKARIMYANVGKNFLSVHCAKQDCLDEEEVIMGESNSEATHVAQKVAVLPVDDEEALIEQTAKALWAANAEQWVCSPWSQLEYDVQAEERYCARAVLVSLGILKAKRKTRRAAR